MTQKMMHYSSRHPYLPQQEWCRPVLKPRDGKLLLKQQYKLLWERMRKATGCYITPGKNGLNKNSKLKATSWPNITLLSTQLTLGNGDLSSLLSYSRIYDIKEKQ